MQHYRLYILALYCLAVVGLGCTLPGMNSGSSSASLNVTATVAFTNDGTKPTLIIETPSNGAQAVINEPITVRVKASDSQGITRVEMREAGRIVVSRSAPEVEKELTALLAYRPSVIGTVTVELYAYRQTVASEKVTLQLQVVTRDSQSANAPNATSGSTVCTAKTNISNLNMRKGAGTQFGVITRLNVDEALPVIGRNDAMTWYMVRRGGTTEGWVSASFVDISGNCGQLPIK